MINNDQSTLFLYCCEDLKSHRSGGDTVPLIYLPSSNQKVLAIDSVLLLDASICVSSANILHFVYFKQLGRSLTYIRNNSGPSIDSWGIPHIISNGLERMIVYLAVLFSI